MMNNYGNWGVGGQYFGLGILSMAGIGLIALVIAAVIITLKGYALWTAAKRDEKWWFIILLVVNTVGILELIYLYFVAKKWQSLGANHSEVSPSVSSPASNTASSAQTNDQPSNSSGDNSHFVKQ
jgi:methionyl-tRNA synthetase